MTLSGYEDQRIGIGAHLKLSGGYDGKPLWLVGRLVGSDFHTGVVEQLIPEPKTWKDRRQGAWVESHASYKLL